jgi:nucleotide-binding universal stress UspA family protein
MSDTGSGSGAARERSEQAPMRVLVAIDGSPGSEVAVDLVAGLAWPAGSVFRFVSAVIEFQEIGYGLFGVPRPDVPVQQPYLDELDAALEAAVARVPAAGSGESAALRGHTTRVISVAQPPALWRAGISPGMYRQVMEDYGAALDALQAEYRDLARDAAGQLAASGTEASVSTPTGDAANEILAACRQMDADLVVLGSRGRTGLQRLVLGSVARNVLVSADASVLVVHLPRAAEDAAER